jgi:hypothetical protein
MAFVIAAARQRINDVGADRDLDGAAAHGEIDLDIESIADSIELLEGKVIYPGQPSRAGRGSCGWSARRARARARAGARSPTGCGPSAVGRSRRAASSRSTASPRCRADRPRTSSRSATRAGREVPHEARGCA